jgi:hypothetical protein
VASQKKKKTHCQVKQTWAEIDSSGSPNTAQGVFGKEKGDKNEERAKSNRTKAIEIDI